MGCDSMGPRNLFEDPAGRLCRCPGFVVAAALFLATLLILIENFASRGAGGGPGVQKLMRVVHLALVEFVICCLPRSHRNKRCFVVALHLE